MHIVVVSNNYPSSTSPNKGAFVYNLVQEIAQIHKVTVIAPTKLNEVFWQKRKAQSYGKEGCTVLRPLYLSFGNRRFGRIDLGKVTFFFQKLASEWCFRRNVIKVDVLYCHFLINAFAIQQIAKKKGIPVVVASGESQYKSLSIFKESEIKARLQNIQSAICVSNDNKSYFESMGYDMDKVMVLPNSVDYNVFKPHDKKRAKISLGIEDDTFVVGFIGHFIERKGPNRLIEAVDSIKDSGKLKVVLVGAGEPLLERDFVIEIDPKPNHALPEVIGAFDVFVLPTLSEGHCNVVEEVKACCVPIISSKGTTVEQQLNGGRGVLVDPTSIEEIAEAIKELRDNNNKRRKIVGLLFSQRNIYTLTDRAKQICRILENAVK